MVCLIERPPLGRALFVCAEPRTTGMTIMNLDGKRDEGGHLAELAVFIGNALVRIRLRWYNQSEKSKFIAQDELLLPT